MERGNPPVPVSRVMPQRILSSDSGLSNQVIAVCRHECREAGVSMDSNMLTQVRQMPMLDHYPREGVSVSTLISLHTPCNLIIEKLPGQQTHPDQRAQATEQNGNLSTLPSTKRAGVASRHILDSPMNCYRSSQCCCCCCEPCSLLSAWKKQRPARPQWVGWDVPGQAVRAVSHKPHA